MPSPQPSPKFGRGSHALNHAPLPSLDEGRILNFRFHRQHSKGGFSGFKHFAQVGAAQAAPTPAPDSGGYLRHGLPAAPFRHTY